MRYPYSTLDWDDLSQDGVTDTDGSTQAFPL